MNNQNDVLFPKYQKGIFIPAKDSKRAQKAASFETLNGNANSLSINQLLF